MRALLICVAAVCIGAAASARADQTISSMQQALKDQGFYYGEITGSKDADTTAALRRYQIRNGLKVTGDLDAETQKSLGIRGGSSTPRSTPAPAARATPNPPPPTSAEPDVSEPDEDLAPPSQAPITPPISPGIPATPPQGGYAPGPGMYSGRMGVFTGTPYEGAPAEVQRDIMLSAQSLLARQGYYRSIIDGAFGPGTEFALRAYQSRFGLAPSGRLDLETLAALGLLPAQRAAGVNTRPGRVIRPRPFLRPGERIYIPR